MHQNIQILYFLLFYYFTEKKSLSEFLIECDSFAKQIGVESVNKQTISTIFNILRGKLKKEMHNKWNSAPLATVNYEFSYGSVEIDESEIIGNSQQIYWMFGIIDRKTKDSRIYCVYIIEQRKIYFLLLKIMY